MSVACYKKVQNIAQLFKLYLQSFHRDVAFILLVEQSISLQEQFIS